MKCRIANILLPLLLINTHEGLAAAVHFDSDKLVANENVTQHAIRKIEWRKHRSPSNKTVVVKILGFNDFHGHISTGTTFAGRPVGGAAVFASYLKAAQVGIENRT